MRAAFVKANKGDEYMKDFKQIVAESLSKSIKEIDQKEIEQMIEVPPNKDMGDYAFPCFKLAKVFRKAPNLIAEELSKEIDILPGISEVKNLGGYVNFFIDNSELSKGVIKKVLEEKDYYGRSEIGKGKRVLVEFSSPNIAKPFHIGHIRTTAIGNCLYKLYDSQGYDVVRINHLGDYGTQFGKLIVAFKLWGKKEEVEANPIPELLKLYVKFHDVAEDKPELEDQAREWFVKLENGDEEAVELWQWFRDESLKEFERVYDMLDIQFDSYAGESFYSDKMPAVVEELEKKDLLTESKGAMIVDLEKFNLPPALIVKTDGSTLYLTRDLAAAFYRKKTYDFYKSIYVVGAQQELHFQQLLKVIELMGYEWAKDMIHVQFGMVALEDGTLSTRRGRVVFLEDVLNKAVEKTKEIIEEKNPEAGDIDEIAKEVGIGAVVFQELSNSRMKDYTFSWEKTLSYEGETGPYVQYTHARTCAVLRKSDIEPTADINYELLQDESSIEVLNIIENFNKVILNAISKNESHHITRFLLDLSQAFNKFYHNNHIIGEDKELEKARIALVDCVRQTIKNGLALLGMKAPNRM